MISECPFGSKGKQYDDIPYLDLDPLADMLEPLSDLEMSKKRSISRTKQKMHDIVNSNEWEYFVTVTFDGKKVSRYDYNAVVKKYSKLLNHIKERKAPGLEYIFVPEKHKDDAFHFHGLIRGTAGLTFIKTKFRDRTNRIIYNIQDFNLGFTEVTKVSNTAKVSTYMIKYITADIDSTLDPNRKRYWASKEIDRTEITRMYLESERQQELVASIQKSKMTVSVKTVIVEKDGYQNKIMYIVYQDYSENQIDNERAWRNRLGKNADIIPYDKDSSMNDVLRISW